MRDQGWSHPYFRGGYVQVSIDGLRELDARIADHSLGMQAVRVLVAMAQSIDASNRVGMGPKDLARHLGMSTSNVAAAIRALIECGFVLRPEWTRAPYRISPKLLWKGTTEGLRKALQEAA